MERSLKAILERCVEDGDCWIWQGGASHGTRPIARISGTQQVIYVHRLVLELLKKPAGELYAYPSCGNPMCVCPDHTRAMTRSDVMRIVAKRKGSAARKTVNSRISSKLRNRSRFTQEEVQAIRDSKESGRALARRLGCDPSTVHDIRAHRTWRDYTNPFMQLARK